ncbi:DNA translocase FtsK [Tistrella mobilis]|jgi:S-DNA-T family DNA segregation ATPase FtsK/SpoIIIE|uniref:DNA translocase FtsK n=1 Tax=Tistrella mobilis TaxID=171437 RepID=UPI003555D790
MTARRPYTLPDLDPRREPEQDNAMPPRAEEFGLWCAMTDRPFRLIKVALDESGQPEWAIEAHPGTEQAAIIYATGTVDEAQALAVAYGFLAGVEWSEAALAPALEPEDAEDWPDEAEALALALSVPLILPPPLMDGELLTAEIIPGEEPVFDFQALAEANAADAGEDVPDIEAAAAGEPMAEDPSVPEAEPVVDDADEAAEEDVPDPVEADMAVDAGMAEDDGPERGGDAMDEDLVDDVLDDDMPDDDFVDEDTSDEDMADEDMADEATPAGDEDEDDVLSGPGSMPAEDGPADETPAWEDVEEDPGYVLPALALLATSEAEDDPALDEGVLADKTRKLETVLRNFRVRGEIMEVRRGPLVTLFELEPVPGTKSSTVINLADDIARSMSAITARIAVVPGRSVIGIELPNESRATVYLREILASPAYTQAHHRLPLALGKNIGGEPVVVDLTRMPHLLIAGTTGSGKSVGINAMILSLLYRLPPEQCRLIMVDPKMLELSVYDEIPHLLTPVVTDPNKAVAALKWVVREMESRYRSMSLLGVRNIEGYNGRVAELAERGEQVTRRVQVGYDKAKQEPIFEEQIVDLEHLPYIVVVVDEMADLMLVAGKEIETLIQRLAQMARAAGIHLIMATQRPSVDVITGTIKANFPTRISFQVTSRIDSRTILGEAGAEQLLGQGDMLFMAAGGRITRVHGPFVSDREVEEVVEHLRGQGRPDYVYSVTEEDDGDGPVEGLPSDDVTAEGEDDGDIFAQAVSLILREDKVSVSFIQRHLQIGYNRAARLVERMEAEGMVSPPDHVGRRQILVNARNYFADRRQQS